MQRNTFDIDTKIKNAFRLFAGERSVEEDQKIYDKVMVLCFDELALFLEENLDTPEKQLLIAELSSLQKTDSPDKVISTLQKHTQGIKNFSFRWDKRINYFLNQLLYSAVKAKKHV